MNTFNTSLTHHEAHLAAMREYQAARAELESLGHNASPSRLERALERVEAAQAALALAA